MTYEGQPAGDALTITHTPAAGTLIEGTARGDGAGPVLRQAGWRWSRALSSWFVPRSRDRRPDQRLIDRTVVQLTAAGFTVRTELDDELRRTAEVEADLIQRQQQRAERLARRAEHAQDTADRADARADELTGRLPLGQPILAGHHSEPAMRRHAARLRAATERAVTAQAAADQARARVDTAAAAHAARHNPVTIANRISALTAQQRRIQRHLDGSTRTVAVLPDGSRHTETTPAATGTARAELTDQLTQVTDQLTYWQQVRAEQIRTGTTGDYGPHSINAGDLVKLRGQWYRVRRTNTKTFRVHIDPGMNSTAGYHQIQDHRPAPATTEPADQPTER